jgi:hypothetical protein
MVEGHGSSKQHTQHVNHVIEEMETSKNQAAGFRILRNICNTDVLLSLGQMIKP